MANNNKNNRNNVNQPRRKRNKKPVKRYSEEYSNRPNPYTGYSADGNYHPEAKIHTLEEASAANAVDENISTASQPVPVKAQVKTVESAVTPVAVKAESKTVTEAQSRLSDNSESSVEYSTHGSTSNHSPSEKTEIHTVNKSIHRKKNSATDKEYSIKARQVKTEARKAAVDKIAKGVAAHSVSEQMIDDITSMSEAIEDFAKVEKLEKAKSSPINWNDLYDSSIDTPYQNASNTEQADISVIKPVKLGDDEILPFDLIKSEQHENSEVADEPALAQQSDGSSQISPLNPEDLIPVLDFDKLPQPVLDFQDSHDDKIEAADNSLPDIISMSTIEEILNAVEQEKINAARNAVSVSRSDDFEFGSDVIFDTSKSEGWDEIVPPPLEADDEHTESDEDETTAPDSVEEISKQLSESYLELKNELNETEETDSLESELEAEVESHENNDNVSAESDAKSDNNISDETFTVPLAGDIFINSETEDSSIERGESLEEIFAEPDIYDDLDEAAEKEATKETTDEDEESAEVQEIIVHEENILENQDAVKKKIERLIEAAELAELLKQESKENELEPSEVENSAENAQSDEPFNVDLNSGKISDSDQNSEVKDAENSVSSEPTSASEEKVKEYRPRERTVDGTAEENVFESVLIIDDTDTSLNTEKFDNQDDTLFLHTQEANECPTAVFKLPEGPIVLPTDIDDGDFQEQWLDGDEDGDEMASRSKRTRRRISAFIGAVTVILVFMIFAGVVKTAVMGINNLGGTGEKKAEYTEFISPVVINDPEPFETIDTADNQMLLESSIWYVIAKTEDYDYEYDATGKIILSADDVAAAGKTLFGNDVKLEMDVLSESDGSTLYYYDSIDHCFHISTGGIIGPAANITKIAQKSGYVSLVVGYSSQTDMNFTSSESDDTECYKYMEYILALNPDGSYYIQSIRDYVED